MNFKTGKRTYNPALKSEMGLTPVPDFTPTPTINYSIKPEPEAVLAKFDGLTARCGGCRSKLGEFVKADGKILCKKNDCKLMNIVKI